MDSENFLHGQDTINGGDGDDILFGSGMVYLDGDSLNGGAGTDTVDYRIRPGVKIDLASGTAQTWILGAVTDSEQGQRDIESYQVVAGCENWRLYRHADSQEIF